MALMQRMSVMKVVLRPILRVQKRVGQRSTSGCDISQSLFSLALDILVKAIEKSGYTGKIKIGMDVAASEFYDEKEKKYDLNNKEKDHPHYVNLARRQMNGSIRAEQRE